MTKKISFLFYLLSHPIAGYYELRHRNEGSVFLALIMVALFSLSFSLNRIYASFIVNNLDPRSVDSVRELAAVFLLFVLLCVGNWSITCLMEGEGRMKDIFTAVGYALTPMVLLTLPATLVSRFIGAYEEVFYYVLLAFAVVWTLILLMIGIMTIHNYTFGKTLVTLGLTFISMIIIIFLAALLVDLINQLYGFIYSIYMELLFRG
ncbi:MAG: YIP1 family protein [Clostridiales bacterium]|nr:YIP1 family protein [Clostridiales bacterium]